MDAPAANPDRKRLAGLDGIRGLAALFVVINHIFLRAFPGYPVGLRAIQMPDPSLDSYFLSLFGRSPRVTACACEREGEVTLPQLLHMQNGDSVVTKIRAAEGRLASILKKGDEAAIGETLFLSTLSRLPREAEKAAIRKALAGEKGDRADVWRDLLWALLNSKEFVFNH